MFAGDEVDYFDGKTQADDHTCAFGGLTKDYEGGSSWNWRWSVDRDLYHGIWAYLLGWRDKC